MRRRQPWDHQSWVKSYEYAVLEIDVTKLSQRIQAAESAISARLVELNNSIDLQEPKALRDALRVLKLMAKHKPSLKGSVKLLSLQLRSFALQVTGNEKSCEFELN